MRRPQPLVIPCILPVTGSARDPAECPRSVARSGPRNSANSSAGWYMSTQPRSLSSACHCSLLTISPSAWSRAFLSARPHLGRRHQAAPVHQCRIDTLLLEGRDVDARQPLGRGDADRPQLAGLDLLRHLVEAAGGDGEMAAHDLRQHLAAGAGDDVVHLGDVAAGRLDDQGAQDVVGAAQREAAPAHRAGVGLELGEQVVHRLDRRVRRHHQRLILAGEPRQRLPPARA